MYLILMLWEPNIQTSALYCKREIATSELLQNKSNLICKYNKRKKKIREEMKKKKKKKKSKEQKREIN